MTCFRWHHYCLNLSPPNCVEHFYHHQKLIKELQQEEGDIQGLKRVWQSKHYGDENIKSFSILLVGWMICLQFFQVLFVLIWQVKCSIIPTLYYIRETLNSPIIVQTEINSNLWITANLQLVITYTNNFIKRNIRPSRKSSPQLQYCAGPAGYTVTVGHVNINSGRDFMQHLIGVVYMTFIRESVIGFPQWSERGEKLSSGLRDSH